MTVSCADVSDGTTSTCNDCRMLTCVGADGAGRYRVSRDGRPSQRAISGHAFVRAIMAGRCSTV
jgi:hypothetical protein